MARPSMPKVTWEKFIEMLDALHSSVSDMSVEQLGCSCSICEVLLLIIVRFHLLLHKLCLSLLLTYFPPSARSPSGASKALPTKQVKK